MSSSATSPQHHQYHPVDPSPSSHGISRRHQHHAALQMTLAKRTGAVKRSSSAVTSSAVSPEDHTSLSTKADLQEEIPMIVSASSDLQSVPSMEIQISEPLQKKGKVKWSAFLDNPSERMGRILVLLAAAIYGTNFATVKLLDVTMPLSISAALRFGLASAVVSTLVLSQENDDADPVVSKERNLALWSGIEIGLWYCIGYIAQAEGLQTVEAGKSAFFNSLAVIVVPILDVFFKGKILKQQELAAVVLACFGVGLLELGPSGGLHITSGDLLAFSQTIFFGIGYWRLESVSHAYPHHAARLTVGLLLAVAVGSALYALVEFGLGHIAPSVDQFIGWLGDPFILCALVWTGLVSTALALYLETVSLKVVSASELTLLMTTISLWGAAFAYVTIGEVLTPTGLLGGFLILGGCVVGNLSPKTKNKQSLPVFREYDEG